MAKMTGWDKLAMWLVIIGAIIWGLFGLFNWNVVDVLFGFNWVARVIYILVGLSGLWSLVRSFQM